MIEDTDRHGNVRLYFRKPGQRKIRLHGLIGSSEFIEQYQAAAAGQLKAASLPRKSGSQATKGSLKWLCEQYFCCAGFKLLEPRTQQIRRRILDIVCQKYGDKPAASLEPQHVRSLRDKHADRPEASNSFLKALRQLYRFAAEMGYAKYNPAREIKYLKTFSDGIHTWTEEEIEQYKRHHSSGSQARLALCLLLNLGQRRSDAVRLGRQFLKDRKIRFVQFKGRKRHRTELSIPVLTELQIEIDQLPPDQMQFLVTQFGKTFTANGFGNKFKRWCIAAGLPHCSSHGLRKACTVRLAEAGCSAHEIAAITGHRSLKEVQRYAQKVNQEHLAQRAVDKLELVENENKTVPLSSAVEVGGTKASRKSLKG